MQLRKKYLVYSRSCIWSWHFHVQQMPVYVSVRSNRKFKASASFQLFPPYNCAAITTPLHWPLGIRLLTGLHFWNNLSIIPFQVISCWHRLDSVNKKRSNISVGFNWETVEHSRTHQVQYSDIEKDSCWTSTLTFSNSSSQLQAISPTWHRLWPWLCQCRSDGCHWQGGGHHLSPGQG